ncbi:MAG: NADH:flavin oxidoreductase [Bacteroidetes bacterium]|nr:NADH:flavin oxidoreductase [Bacteroidota bacterium]MCL5025427.1 NADH:flavin oxidoreductase [Chloroflexota bacterium]
MAGLLFSPIAMGPMTMKNRIVYPPMGTRYDITTARARAYYAERALGGCGLVIVEGTRVDNFADPQFVTALPALAQAIHRGGAKACVQMSHPPSLPDGEAIAPSAADSAREVTAAEIRNIQEKYALAAACLKKAGFDAAEVHGAHGYFFSQFFSPRANRRTDAYGGSLENRMRFARETVRLIRLVVGREFPLLYRMSADEFHPQGPGISDSQALAAALENDGVTALDVSAAIAGQTPSVTSPIRKAPEGTYAYLAALIKQVVRVPVIAVGRICRSEVAEQILASGQADLVAIGRQLLADPFWPKKVAEGRDGEVVACRYDNHLCLGNLNKQMPIACSVNPRAGREYEAPLPLPNEA